MWYVILALFGVIYLGREISSMLLLNPFTTAFYAILGMSLAFIMALSILVVLYHVYEYLKDVLHDWRWRQRG